MTRDEVGHAAIKHALRSLRQRHLVEEAAHSPAYTARFNPSIVQGSEWKEKAENLDLELQQCYKAQSRLSEQLVVEVAECKSSKALLKEKEAVIVDLQCEFTQTRDENSQLEETLDEKMKSLDLVLSENATLRAQLEEATFKFNHAKAENKKLIDQIMLLKMEEAEKMNEEITIDGDRRNQDAACYMEQLAPQRVDGVVRHFEEKFSPSTLPTVCKRKIPGAHVGGCGSLLFEHNSSRIITGGQDQKVRVWDSETGVLSSTLHGCLGSVLDIAVTHDNGTIIAASSSNNLYVWDVGSGRVRHTLTGHTNKVCAVDVSRGSTHHVVSAAYDHTMKVWDLKKGYWISTITCPSNCNAICFSMDGSTVCSGHMDGYIRLWDTKSGKNLGEVGPHASAITSVCLSRDGNTVLSSGKDNSHNLYDIRSLEVSDTLRATGYLGSNWSRSCFSSDENYVVAGSANGPVYVWSRKMSNKVSPLTEHTAPVLCCSWSDMGKPLATADKSGTICVWA